MGIIEQQLAGLKQKYTNIKNVKKNLKDISLRYI